MSFRRSVFLTLALVLCIVAGSSSQAFGQDAPVVNRGRKYKAPPPTSHIEVVVLKKENGKPIMNAAVVFNPTLKGKDLGNLEVKTDPDGKAIIDVIPTGSKVNVQVIATGFATFAEDILIDKPTKAVSISMLRPREQISAYQDNEGKAAVRNAGVQEPVRPKPATTPASSTPPASTSAPASNSAAPATTPNQ